MSSLLPHDCMTYLFVACLASRWPPAYHKCYRGVRSSMLSHPPPDCMAYLCRSGRMKGARPRGRAAPWRLDAYTYTITPRCTIPRLPRQGSGITCDSSRSPRCGARDVECCAGFLLGPLPWRFMPFIVLVLVCPTLRLLFLQLREWPRERKTNYRRHAA
jgi:hypothetical protein